MNHNVDAGSHARKPKRSRLSHFGGPLAALASLALIALWMLSGQIVVGGGEADKVPPLKSADTASSGSPAKLFRVRAETYRASRRDDVLHIRARSEAEKSVEVRAETAGRVLSLGGRKGEKVTKGSNLCKLDIGARKAALAGAKAQVEQAKANYAASNQLSTRGYSAELDTSAKRAALEAASAALEQAELDLANTDIKAPFDGVIEDQPAKVGHYLAVGGTCAKLVSLNPLLVVGEVSERDVSRVKLGAAGRAELVTGETAEGRVRFISPSASEMTRTFRVELEIDNRSLKMLDGITADVYIPLAPISGHRVSPGLLTLSDSGEVGVRTIERDDIVRFHPVRILDQGKDGAFVTGLPDKVKIITVGQDFVTDGQKVDVTSGEPAATGGDNGRS